jgi:CheY-like chemotaxis protein
VSASDVLDALVALAWPILIGVVVWRLLPTVRKILDQRGFTIKAGSTEITVQQASDQLVDRLEDLREQVSALKLQVAGIKGVGGAQSSPIAAGVPKLHRILWVDDYPENNAYEVEALQRKGVRVQLARSTADALREVRSADPPYDAIITDMGRREGGEEHPQAGLELIAQLRAQGVQSPVYVYASAPAVGRARQQLEDQGVPATASATELLEMLGRLGLQ